MKRGSVHRRLCRLEDQLRGLLANWPIPALQVATLKETKRMLELLAGIKGQVRVKISPEKTPELWALLETLDKRLRTRLGQK